MAQHCQVLPELEARIRYRVPEGFRLSIEPKYCPLCHTFHAEVELAPSPPLIPPGPTPIVLVRPATP